MKVYTIGFTRKSARRFFDLLRASGAPEYLERKWGELDIVHIGQPGGMGAG